ncbi:ribosome silencing factor [Plectonema cf. radiosum LEGE 06105]|uniref:Ribosomal silencing factor RsfS n=1 Tax=Plectonema cf. radiosum LEGE 06105 TaxID=945769 RepID=A0A8J7F6X1_9CYAN|nr:ribosome silencing factor [Plectonema radiosum]MBE9215165.1 ribosome silencing factor [Plectonema cf. radiosum LEGE 06105]
MSDYFPANLQSEFITVTNAKIADQQLDIDDSSVKLALAIVEAGDNRKAGDMLVLSVKNVSYLADYFVMMTGYSNVQVRAIANTIESFVEEKCSRNPLRTEGKPEGSWVVLDYGDVIVHIMMPSEREFYNLEAFWGHAERVDFQTSFKSGGEPI